MVLHKVIFLCPMLLLVLSCSENTDKTRSVSDSQMAGASQDDISDPLKGIKPFTFKEFQGTITKHCVPCHGGRESKFTNASDFSTLKTIEDWKSYPNKLLVAGSAKDSTVYSSLIYAKSVPSSKKNMPFPTSDIPMTFTEEEANRIGAYINSLKAEVEAPPTYASNLSALTKVKYLLNGEALNSDEMVMALADDKTNLEPKALKTLVQSWYEQKGCTQAFGPFLTISLQQDSVYNFPRRDELLGHPRINRAFGNEDANFISRATERQDMLQQSIQASFVRTICDLIDRNEPIHKIYTTRRWAMTSALLSTLLFIDSSPSTPSQGSNYVRYLFDPRNNTIADFRDWRFINFIQRNQDNVPPNHTNIEGLRRYGNESQMPLRIPRVGFFNTLGFQIKWQTNDDNQFRVTSSQAVIAALEKRFNASDQTQPGSLAGLDQDHAPNNSACYSCHKFIDPMRQVFKNVYGASYRPVAASERDVKSAAFAFMGHKRDLQNMDQFGEALADHPRMATAWVQKICSYANASWCNEDDPEFMRLVSRFKENNYNFRETYFDVVTSPIVTGQNPYGDSDMGDFRVTTPVADQFCQAINQRYRQAYQKKNMPANAMVEDLCDLNNNIRTSTTGLGNIAVVRGMAGLMKPSSNTPFRIKSTEILCRQFANALVGGDDRLFSASDGQRARSMTSIVEDIMGLLPNHPRSELASMTLTSVYNRALQLGMTPINSMKEVFIFACTSPELTGVGL